MNEIKSISSLATTSGAGGAAQTQVQQHRPIALNEANGAGAVEKQQPASIDSENIKKLVEQANARLTAAANERVSFSYEERLNRLYVQIKDNATGEVVREIPPRRLIESQAALSEMIGIILDRNA